jgi:lysophospholipase L1-like esterase
MTGRSRRRVGLAILTFALVIAASALTYGGEPFLRSLGLGPARRWLPAYRDRLAAHAAENASLTSGCRILLGDSLAEHFPRALSAAHGWINRGISGDRIDDVAARLDVSALHAPCATVILLIGTNDIVTDAAAPENAVADIRAVVDRLVAAGRKVVLQTIPPTRGRHAGSLSRVHETNRLLRAASWPTSVELVDLEATLRDDGGQLRAEFSSDGLHLNEAGYRRWADLLATEVGAKARRSIWGFFSSRRLAGPRSGVRAPLRC